MSSGPSPLGETALGSSWAGPCCVPLPTWTSSKGSNGVAHGKTTYQSSATAATARPIEPASLPRKPNGSFCQIQAYIALLLDLGRHAGVGQVLVTLDRGD